MIKVAVITMKLSHFEVPMFRLVAQMEGIELKVFHNDLRGNTFEDADYGTTINWGERMREGFANTGYETREALSQAVIDWKPDVALQYGYFWKGALGLLWRLRRAGIPVVHRGLLTPYHNTRQNWLVTRVWRRMQPFLLRSFQAHHYGGTYSETVLERAGIAAERRYFVPYSVDTTYFLQQSDDPAQIDAARAIRQELGWADNDTVLLFMCQHSWFKAPDVMMRVLLLSQERHPGIKLIMAGSGLMTDECRAFAERHLRPGSFYFPGYVSSKSTVPIYLASDLVFFPSRYDTWSRGVNEAMLARRACIVSKIVPAAGGLVEHGKNGYVVEELEPSVFADSVDAWLSLSATERTTMSNNARERAKFFSYEAHADDLRRSFVETVDRYRERQGMIQ